MIGVGIAALQSRISPAAVCLLRDCERRTGHGFLVFRGPALHPILLPLCTPCYRERIDTTASGRFGALIAAFLEFGERRPL